jgi:hypothetical protein
MPISYYPNRIRTFPVHQNLLDDVDANHINNIQNELAAVMFALGTSPQVFNDIQTDFIPTTVTPNDEGGVIDDDTLFQSTVRYYDPKVKPVDHGNVGQRMDDIERGRQFHCFRLRGTGMDIASGNAGLSTRPRGIRLPKPNSDNDPYDMHNGVGVTLRKSGFWMFAGNVVFTLQGNTAGSNNGDYNATIDYDGNYLDGMVRDEISGRDKHPVLGPTLFGFFSRGTRVSLRASHNSGRLQKIRMARLAGALLRETIDT